MDYISKKQVQMSDNYLVNNSQELESFGEKLLPKISTKNLVFLRGELGTGKTTLTRGILRGFGFFGLVKSPTYTLVETYQLPQKTIHHFDLYRITSAHELEEMGFRDYLTKTNLVIIEWPERVDLPKADIEINLKYHPKGREINVVKNN